jgi:hypothetical protein
VSALGIGVDAFWRGSWSAQRCAAHYVIRSTDLTSPIAAEVPDFDPLQWVAAERVDVMDRFSQFAVAPPLRRCARLDFLQRI